MIRPLNVAVVGAGPAGVFTADILRQQPFPTRVDLFERLPVPFGLVRYGVAPDHPRIKAIIDSLHAVLDRRDIRLVAGVDVGTDIGIDRLRAAYDAVILTTGADDDAPLPIPGVDLPGSFGASAFVSWYDAHPDAAREWPLDAEHVAVIGAGNVALDVTRMLAKHADDLLSTEIPDHVHEGLRRSRITDVHVFARRGPAEAAFSPLELRELGEVADVDVIVDPADMVFDRSSEELMKSSNQRRIVARTIREWSERDPATRTASRRIHLHFMQAPVRLDGTDRVEGITVERTRHLVNGTVEGTGELRHYPVGQVYRAVGYASSPVPGVPFDPVRRRIPNDQGRVLDSAGTPIPGLYVSGWIKRGPVGLIGSTKSDSLQTVSQLVADLERRPLDGPDRDPLPPLREAAGVTAVDWDGWLRVDAHERALGAERGRERIKVADRGELRDIAARAEAVVA
ncbi:FAD-dependent oxidoreductase [Microbacterium resistens]